MSEPIRGVMLVTRNLPPLIGGMERLNQNIARELSLGFAVTVVGPEGCAAHLPSGLHVIEVPLRPLPWFLSRALAAALKHSAGAGVVIAGSGLTAPIVWLVARLRRIHAAAYVHGLDIVVDHKLYQWLWMPFLRGMDSVLANSRNTAALAAGRGVDAARIRVLHPGVDVPAIDHCTSHRGGRPQRMLSVGRITWRKGLPQFVERCLPRIVQACPDVVLQVIGGGPAHALAARDGAVAKVRESIVKMGLQSNFEEMGHCSESELLEAYRRADVHVFPILDIPGDVEGFGMVAVEAAANGLPTVAFSVGGVPDAVEEGRSGHLVAAGDYEGFADHVIELLRTSGQDRRALECHDFAIRFSWQGFGEKLRALVAAWSSTTGKERGRT